MPTPWSDKPPSRAPRGASAPPATRATHDVPGEVFAGRSGRVLIDIFSGCCAAVAGKEEPVEEIGAPRDSTLDHCMGRLKEVVSSLSDMQQRHNEAMQSLECLVTVIDKRLSASGSVGAIGAFDKGMHGTSNFHRDEVVPDLGDQVSQARATAKEDEVVPDLGDQVSQARAMAKEDGQLAVKPNWSVHSAPGAPPTEGAAATGTHHAQTIGEPTRSLTGKLTRSLTGKLTEGAAATASFVNCRVRGLLMESRVPSRVANSLKLAPTRELGLKGWVVAWAKAIMSWHRFEYIMGLIIIANSVCIGVETQSGIYHQKPPQTLAYMEHFFLVIYVLEVTLRLIARGRVAWDSWFVFDVILVIAGCLATWVLEPLQNSGTLSGLQGLPLLEFVLSWMLMAFRVCRLLRLLQALRKIPQFRSIWRLVYGLLTSLSTMISTLALVSLFLYVFACLGIELITKDEGLHDREHPELKWIVDTYFKDLFVTGMFLFQFVTLDSVAAVYMPLIKAKPVLALYFVMILLVVSLTLGNLVMAKIVQSVLDAAHADDEMDKLQRKQTIRKMIPVLENLFRQMDQDNSGKVEMSELENIGHHIGGLKMPTEIMSFMEMDSVKELFDILDVDQSGEVDQEEFLEGILAMFISDVPIQQMQMLKIIRVLRDKAESMDLRMTAMATALGIRRPVFCDLPEDEGTPRPPALDLEEPRPRTAGRSPLAAIPPADVGRTAGRSYLASIPPADVGRTARRSCVASVPDRRRSILLNGAKVGPALERASTASP